MKKGSIQGSICFKLAPKLLVRGPLSKVALRYIHARKIECAQWVCKGSIKVVFKR